MNSQSTPEIQNAYANQTHQRMLHDAAHNRLMRDLDRLPVQTNPQISAKTKALLLALLAILIPLAATLAAAAGNALSSGGGKFLVY